MISYKFNALILLFIVYLVSISYAQPNVYVDPPNQLIYGQKTATINIRISEAITIRSYSVKIIFDDTILKFKSATKGTFLSNSGQNGTIFYRNPNTVTNFFFCEEAILGVGYPPSGSGLLFSAQFDILSSGQSLIKIDSVVLYQPPSILVTSTYNSGYINIIGKVLVIDDSETKSTLGPSSNLFSSSLTTAGYFVDQVNFSGLNTSTLSNYDFVVLSAGIKESLIFNDATKRTALTNYTLAGGKTLVEGGDVGYIFRKEESIDLDPEFRRNILLDSSWVSNMIGSNLQITNSNHPIFKIPNNISSPTTITINNGGLSGSGARDEMTLLPKTGVSRIANWVGGTSSNGGILLYNTNGDTAKCRNVFYTFSIANFADQTLAGKLIVNTARYLMRDAPPPKKTLNLTAIIEGFYDGVNMISDTIIVELRNAVSPYTLLESQKIFLNTSGFGTGSFSTATDATPYYIVVKHRNSIETWSATGQSFISGLMNYDFSASQSRAFGNNLVKKGTKWCIYSGDVNQDGFVNSVDLTLIANDAFNFSSGYKTPDITGDDFVDSNDLVICDDNAYKLVGVLKPRILSLQLTTQK